MKKPNPFRILQPKANEVPLTNAAENIAGKFGRVVKWLVLTPFIAFSLFQIASFFGNPSRFDLLIVPAATLAFFFRGRVGTKTKGPTFVAFARLETLPADRGECRGELRFFTDPSAYRAIAFGIRLDGRANERIELSGGTFDRDAEGWRADFAFSRLPQERMGYQFWLECDGNHAVGALPISIE